METKIRIGAVSYLNTRPLIYGFDHGLMKDKVDLYLDYPSNIAAELISGNIDVGLVPIAVLPKLANGYFIISDYCIACYGPVASVSLFSEVPINEINEILLDYQSRTSVALVKLIAEKYWKINPVFTEAKEDFINNISGNRAAVIIGDRALQNLNNFKFVYDLGDEWKKHTNLPFVFAAWVSNKKLNPEFIEEFNNTVKVGFDHLDEIISECNAVAINYDLRKYYTENLSFILDKDKYKAIDLFLQSIQ